MSRTSTTVSVLPFMLLLTLPSCDETKRILAGCPFFVGHDPIAEARQDFGNGERHLLVGVNASEVAVPFIAGFPEKSCNFAYDRSGRMLRSNKRYFPPMPSSDAMNQKERACVDAFDTYSQTYNRELSRLHPRAFDETCSKLTPAQVESEVDAELTNGS